ncbi:hypothetical protein C2G38_2185715 [Gigaspora rosea]|uniref:Uncharacterized protein n=1 Tax=Gigaspora rosea TaxID=44941 RepID=A0A397V7I9_9GLOM|nr:hypothetical protein C2G38_2185715 [Gigaspora rosea]
MPPRPIIGKTAMMIRPMTLEDDDYNVDEGRHLDNFSENSEWCEENDFNEYENSGQ